MDEGRQPLSRKLPIPSSKINPYRLIILLRLVVLGVFFHYRIRHPVNDAYGLWLTSVICEIWFGVSWIFDQFPKWFPIMRETYLDRLSLRYFFFSCFSVSRVAHLAHKYNKHFYLFASSNGSKAKTILTSLLFSVIVLIDVFSVGMRKRGNLLSSLQLTYLLVQWIQ